MATRWKTLSLRHAPSQADADLVLVSGPPFVCAGSELHADRVLDALGRVHFSARPGETLDLIPETAARRRVVVLGTGAKTPASECEWLSTGGFLVEAMSRHRLASIRIPERRLLGDDSHFEQLVLGALLHSFQLAKGASARTDCESREALVICGGDRALAERASQSALAINRARAWIEAPANLLTPPTWCEEARQVFAARGARVLVLGPPELERLGGVPG